MKAHNVTLPAPYHKGRASRTDHIAPEQRKFIAWDGEGMFLSGEHKPQHYVLFGCAVSGTRQHYRITSKSLSTFEILDLIIRVGREHPDAYHIGFAFNYDANMILRGLREDKLRTLYKSLNNSVHVGDFTITYRPGKFFRVTKRLPGYNRETNANAKITVTIFDVFGFFTSSFVAAAEKMLGADYPGMQTVIEGKAQRAVFTWDELDMVTRYWTIETEILAAVGEELRRRLYGAGLLIRQWYGPGALASYKLRQEKSTRHMREFHEPIREASRYAYAGGRFELYKVGRIDGPIYSLDINSAYPFGIAQLPSFSDGGFEYVTNPTNVHDFGMYHVRLNIPAFFAHQASPLFHRDRKHNISYPWVTEGWYWGPEVKQLLRSVPRKHYTISEGWVYKGATDYAFPWVAGVYEKRREWKAAGYSTELALKLLLNSLYGKMAQRVGWDQASGRKPPFHQLEWAGWVTSNTRAMLYDVIRRIPYEHLIAVETDGIYTTMSPDALGISNSKELGGWEVDEYAEIMYVQSGLAWLRKSGGDWVEKRRGLNRGSFALEDCASYLKSLHARPTPENDWKPYVGSQTRFMGLGASLQADQPLKTVHCTWRTADRLITPGEKGKRVHIASACRACAAGVSAYETAHDLVIRSLSRAGEMSTQHSIPWEGQDTGATAEWREQAEREAGYEHQNT